MIREEFIEYKRITDKKINKREKREGSVDDGNNVDDLSDGGLSDNKQPEKAPERKKLKLISLKSDVLRAKIDDIDTSKEEEDDDSDY